MEYFNYDKEILIRFPHISGGFIVGNGLKNGVTPVEVNRLYQQEQDAVKNKIGTTPLSELPTLAGWRTAFRSFGVDPTGYRSAAEALLRRLTKKGNIPSINTIVDLCNLISIRYGLPVAAIDTRQVNLPITVRFARGDEAFVNLNQLEADHPSPGEVVFTDEKDVVIARRWCWRQSEESAAREETTDVLITIEAQSEGGSELVKMAANDLQVLLAAYTGGEYSTFFLP